ncbi:glycosyltransferase [Opitutales bacterium]|nr:glycosyltransferase [Opitutales bacterium]
MEKIYIDVTQSCRSSNNSGIQVVTRNIFREFKSIQDTVPIIWDNHLCKYAYLNKKELRNLQNPFPRNYKSKARPNKQENPFYKELINSILRIRKSINFYSQKKENDFIVLPEVFRDKRVKHLLNLLPPGFKKVGLFYDANVLRDTSNIPDARSKNFKEYLQILATCDFISCISNESQEAFFKHAPKRKVSQVTEVHYLPVEKPSFEKSFPATNYPLILCVSTLGYNKNHLTFLKAAEQLWNEKLKFTIELVGQADPSWSPQILKLIEYLQKKGRPITWLQHVDQETLEIKYARCLFTVYPSLFEGFGLPILESLIRGKPCICGKNGALGEVSKGGGCYNIANQEDINELTNAIRKLLTKKSLLEKLIKEATLRKFDNWKDYSHNLLSFFQQTVGL